MQESTLLTIEGFQEIFVKEFEKLKFVDLIDRHYKIGLKNAHASEFFSMETFTKEIEFQGIKEHLLIPTLNLRFEEILLNEETEPKYGKLFWNFKVVLII